VPADVWNILLNEVARWSGGADMELVRDRDCSPSTGDARLAVVSPVPEAAAGIGGRAELEFSSSKQMRFASLRCAASPAVGSDTTTGAAVLDVDDAEGRDAVLMIGAECPPRDASAGAFIAVDKALVPNMVAKEPELASFGMKPDPPIPATMDTARDTLVFTVMFSSCCVVSSRSSRVEPLRDEAPPSEARLSFEVLAARDKRGANDANDTAPKPEAERVRAGGLDPVDIDID